MKADRFGPPVKAQYPLGWYPTTAGVLRNWRKRKRDLSELARLRKLQTDFGGREVLSRQKNCARREHCCARTRTPCHETRCFQIESRRLLLRRKNAHT